MRVAVRQLGVNVSVRVLAASGQAVDEVDRSGIGESERVLLLADSPTLYRIEIRPSGRSPGKSYGIKIEDLRRATEKDRLVVNGLRVLSRAERLYQEGRAESLLEAVEKLQEAANLLEAGEDREGQAMALIMLGLSHRTMGDNLKALDCYTRALPLCREVGMLHKESAALNNIAGIYHSRGQVEKAKEHYDQAVSILRQLGDAVAEAIVLNNLATISMSLGEHQQALNDLRQALTLRRAVGDVRGEAITLNNFAYVYGELGNLQAAIKSLDEALPKSQQSKDRRLEAMTLNNLGMAYRLAGDYHQAKTYIEKALPTPGDSSTPATEMVALNNLGAVHIKLGEAQKAIERLEQALNLARAIEERHREATILSNLGMAYRELRQQDLALRFLSQALELRRLVGDRSGEADTLHGIALVERDRGRLLESQAKSEEAIRIVESLRSGVGSQDLRTTYLASKRDYYELCIDTLMQLDRQNPSMDYGAVALRTSEQARARTMLDTITETRANIRQGVDRNLLERERGLQQLINSREAYRTQFAANRKTQKQADEIEEELKRLIGEYQEVREQIRLKSPRYASLTEPATLGLKEIQQLLDNETLLLEYSLGKSASYLWAVTDSSLRSFSLPPRDEIESAARRVYELLTARNRRLDGETTARRRMRAERADAEYWKAAAELSRMLLGPVATQLDRKRVVIVADGALQYIPFAALPAPAVAGQMSKRNRPPDPLSGSPAHSPLILRHEIVSLPSASALAALRKESTAERPPAKLVAVFADPVFEKDDPRIKRGSPEEADQSAKSQQVFSEVERSAKESGVSGFHRLRFTRFEAEAISSLAPRGGSLKAVDFEASRQKATSDDLNQYRILHFATHGLLNNETPELTGLVLSLVDEGGNGVDGFLRLHEIYNLRLNADLVVLSACQTALGKEVRGEGLVGLTRGFMYAGAPRVVASLWSVEDRGTAELMKRFYRKIIAEGMKPAAALRASQTEMSGLRQWSSPYYWAAFVIQGEWR
jgi:CHAT domain-containing protein/Tfp pilus assembly protein PilF